MQKVIPVAREAVVVIYPNEKPEDDSKCAFSISYFLVSF